MIQDTYRVIQYGKIWAKTKTNLIYFMIYVDKNTEKGVKMVIYEGEICSNTLYNIALMIFF